MKQAVAGVTPSDLEEATVMIVWPSIAMYPSGQFLGRLYSVQWPNVYIFRLGNLLALLSIPHALALYFYRLLPAMFGCPCHGTWYRLTNRRVIECRNEINLGPGSAVLRIIGGVKLVAIAAIVWCLCQQFAFGWTFPPETLVQWIVTIACGIGLVLGLIPLIAELLGTPLPSPVFSYGVETKSVQLDRFDSIEIVRLPGQEWFDAGDLIFKQGDTETFRLAGVSRPEAFRHCCLKSHMAYVGVKAAMQRQPAA